MIEHGHPLELVITGDKRPPACGVGSTVDRSAAVPDMGRGRVQRGNGRSRLKKAFLLSVRSLSYRWHVLNWYYWAERELYHLSGVLVLPEAYYRWLFRLCMRLLRYHRLRRLADRAIHTIPYHIRFQIA